MNNEEKIETFLSSILGEPCDTMIVLAANSKSGKTIMVGDGSKDNQGILLHELIMEKPELVDSITKASAVNIMKMLNQLSDGDEPRDVTPTKEEQSIQELLDGFEKSQAELAKKEEPADDHSSSAEGEQEELFKDGTITPDPAKVNA